MRILGDLYTIFNRLLLADARFFEPKDGVGQMIEEGINQIEGVIAQAMNVEQAALAGISKDTEIPKAVIPVAKSFFSRLKEKDGQIFGYLPT